MTPESYADLVAEDQRLMLLQQLQSAADYTAHEHLLRARLAELGHRLSAAQVRAHLGLLDELGLITLMGDQIRVARLTLRGDDVASGVARCDGVARPRP